ncbi:hypothetical protein Golax_022832, partial [Gossypium laxum]|nr:hypothetical protein [Gossypium laxum]
MPVIGEVNILTHHEHFQCRSEGGNMYCITNTKWSRFVRTRINAMITLYSKEDGEDFHKVQDVALLATSPSTLYGRNRDEIPRGFCGLNDRRRAPTTMAHEETGGLMRGRHMRPAIGERR